MLPSQVYPHSFIKKTFEGGQVAATITIVKVTHPSSHLLIKLLDYYLSG